MPTTKRQDPLKPRKSPTQGRATQTVEAILESAAHILETEGFDGYNTNAIAVRAGVSIGSLYQYFGNKDGIVMALIAVANGRLLTAISSAAALSDPNTAMDAMISAAVDHQLRRPRLAQILDLEEHRLYRSAARDDMLSSRLHLEVLEVVERLYGPHPELPCICADLVAITRAICDAAGSRQGNSRAVLQERIRKAIRGYLREQFAVPTKAQ
jgi:AcrR family transcriptional regulator